jgi:hypothetical protein
MSIDPKIIDALEEKLKRAIVEVIMEMGLKRLPLLPSSETMHLMAKAAVAVYESAVDNNRPRQD